MPNNEATSNMAFLHTDLLLLGFNVYICNEKMTLRYNSLTNSDSQWAIISVNMLNSRFPGLGTFSPVECISFYNIVPVCLKPKSWIYNSSIGFQQFIH